MFAFIVILLAVLTALLLWLGFRTYSTLSTDSTQAPSPEEDPPPSTDMVLPSRPARADALVYLYGNRFAKPSSGKRAVARHLRAFCPLADDEELDSPDWSAKMLFALLAEAKEAKQVDFRLVERTPARMAPFPHKNWELEVKRQEPLPATPLGDCMNNAFEIMEKRASRREDLDNEGWIPLDLVFEQMLKEVRGTMTFWQREGVYSDLRNYVAKCLVQEGYLVEQDSGTLVEQFRKSKLVPREDLIRALEGEAEDLRLRLRDLRERYGSSVFLEKEDRESTYTHLNTPAALTTLDSTKSPILWADALGVSIYESLAVIRQLEPTGEGGI
jgi:hypothetical protein